MHMWMATYDNGLAATYYGPCKVSALAADRVPVEIVCRTDYPFNEVIEMSVKPARDATFPLSFRIPGWCKNPELSVNGSAVAAAPDAKGFVRVQRLWKPGDAIRLRFPMSVSVKTGRDNNAQGARLCVGLLWPAAFRPADCGHQGPEHARPGRQVEVCAGRARREPGSRHHRGASGDARQMGLAAGIAAEAAGQRRGMRLDAGAQGTSPAVCADREPEAAGKNHADSLRMHQVPRFDVPDYRAGLQVVGLGEAASNFGEVRRCLISSNVFS